ncbi:MAG TPA: hypothetical protein VHF23_07810 [Gaiellaceae bacterium]|nr:hypothetical protein [Gaiellaceae bacterium]
MDKRILLALGGALAAVVLFLVLRPEDEDAAGVATATGTDAAPPTTGTSETTDTSETTTTAPAPEPVRVVVEVRDGGPVGGVRRVAVDRGERVELVVRSDVADRVHVHGVDIFRDVGPGAPARLRFRASTPGVVEVELEDRHLLLAELEVRP